MTVTPCPVCANTPTAPCTACRHNRAISQLRAEHAALIEVYVVAARLRTFPVPFDEHFELIGVVDACRSVVELPIDDGPGTIAPEESSAGQGQEVSGWQAYVAAHPREEFLAAFRDAHAALHQLWTAQVGKEGYDKAQWKALDSALSRFARDAAEKVGIQRSEPLL